MLEEINKRLQQKEAKKARALLETAVGALQAFNITVDMVTKDIKNGTNRK